jgi:hypothetical protein
MVLADFEGESYGDWKVEGEAFGPKPAAGTLERQQAVSGFQGKGLVNTFRGGDRRKVPSAHRRSGSSAGTSISSSAVAATPGRPALT